MGTRERSVEQRYTPDEVAELLRVDISTVWRKISRKAIWPIEKLGRRSVRIPASSVNRYLEQCRCGD